MGERIVFQLLWASNSISVRGLISRFCISEVSLEAVGLVLNLQGSARIHLV